MKKVGLITLFHKNYNYGEALQTYALNRYLNAQGYEAATVLYANDGKVDKGKLRDLKQKYAPLKVYTSGFRALPSKIIGFVKRRLNQENYAKIKHSLEEREYRFEELGRDMDATKKVYKDDSLGELNIFLDAFLVCGDVGKAAKKTPCSPYFAAAFSTGDKRLVAYATDFLNGTSPTAEEAYLCDHFARFHYISTRSEADARRIGERLKKQVPPVVDSVFLMDEKDWSALLEQKKTGKLKERYAFVYLTGRRKKYIRQVEKYCEKHALRLVNIPFLSREYDKRDLYGDTMDIAAGPWEFLSYIKHAEIVFTDSYHACAFSWIFNKKCVAFRKYKDNSGKNGSVEALFRAFNRESALLPYDAKFKQLEETAALPSLRDTDGVFKQAIDYSKYFLWESLQ